MVIISKTKEKRQKYCFLLAVILCLCVTSCETLSNKGIVQKRLLGRWDNTSKTTITISDTISDENADRYENLIPYIKNATWVFTEDTLTIVFNLASDYDSVPIIYRHPYSIHEENNEFYLQSAHSQVLILDVFVENLRIISLTDKELVMTTNTPYNTKGVIADYYLVRHN